MAKYARLREHLRGEFSPERLDFRVPEPADDRALCTAHDGDYVARVVSGELSELERRRIGFPWSPAMVERSRRSTGATLQGARTALNSGASVNLAGGTHHACASHGQGFCVFNDAAVTIRVLQHEKAIRRAVIIDLDVHQGNGSASIFQGDPSVFTFSMHGAGNYPFAKCDGDLDIALPDGTTDELYLEHLHDALHRRLPLPSADLVVYLAGADPYEHDRLGRLKLSQLGLQRRDQMVIDLCHQLGIPLVVAMAGGYCPRIEEIVQIHAATVTTLVERFT